MCPEPKVTQTRPELSFLRRCGLWLATWAVALIITVPNLKGVLLIWVFPFGLLRLLGWPSERYVVVFTVGWLPYVVLTVAALLTRRRSTYFVIYSILCALLVVNVVGCRMMFAELKDAH